MDGLQPSAIAIAEFGNAGKLYGIRDEKVAEDRSEEKYELDGIHDGLVFPTEEERATLRRVPDAIPWSAYRMPQFYSFHVIYLNRTIQSLRLLNWLNAFLFVSLLIVVPPTNGTPLSFTGPPSSL